MFEVAMEFVRRMNPIYALRVAIPRRIQTRWPATEPRSSKSHELPAVARGCPQRRIFRVDRSYGYSSSRQPSAPPTGRLTVASQLTRYPPVGGQPPGSEAQKCIGGGEDPDAAKNHEITDETDFV